MTTEEDAIAQTVDILKTQCRTKSLDEAIKSLSFIPANLLARAREKIEFDAKQIRILRDPPAIEADTLKPWYPGPSANDKYWPRVKQRLSSAWKNPGALEKLERESTKVVSDFNSPHLPVFSGRGLVAGDVQSGKTSNFTAVLSKSADAGYRLFIVLSGTKNKLRKQTQQRLVADLVGDATSEWMVLTSDDHDFGVGNTPSANSVLANTVSQPALIVIKKNSVVLDRLLKWLRGAQKDLVIQTPSLVIDDEADEASLNTKKSQEERSNVNRRILELLKLLQRVSFVGYTATPYANFFVDASVPDDLYPRDFIIPLGSSKEYFGYERIFGRERTRFDESDKDIDGLDVVRPIGLQEADLLKPKNLESGAFKFKWDGTPELLAAIEWFLLATAARYARGQSDKHSSMLIHTSQRTAIHRVFSKPVADKWDEMSALISAKDKNLIGRLKARWENETARVRAAEFNCPSTLFEELRPHLTAVCEIGRVVVENSLAAKDQRLVYGEKAGVYIVIGGDVLSRGLTLEGLVTSYFTRSATTYDTLMQMGRWFGYRPGYADLPRVWMTDELRSAFFELGGIDREMRQQIERTYSGHVTPEEFAPMIRTHPSLAITSRMKMQGQLVRRRLAYGNRRVQTILFNRKPEWLRRNLRAADVLVSSALKGSAAKEGVVPNRFVIRAVDVDSITRFISEYSFHEESWNLNPQAIDAYIQGEVKKGSLRKWNVVLVGGQDESCEPISLGGLPLRTIVRSRINAPDLAYSNIKSLVSEDDFVADLQTRPKDISAFSEVIELRNSELPNTGLIVLYPIDRNSPPKDDSDGVRVALDSPETVIGVALAFPAPVGKVQDGVYITQDLRKIQVEEPDVDDDEPEAP